MKARKYVEHHRVAAFVGFTLLLVLVVGLAILIPQSMRGGTPTAKPTPTTGIVTPTSVTKPTPVPSTGVVTPTPTPAEASPTPEPRVVLGPQACPNAVKGTAYWDKILGTQGSNSKVVAVSCASIMGNPSLQALVNVRHNDANGTLDVYGFDNITGSQPTRLFKIEGLVKGDAKISYYSSVMTAQVDENSSLNAGKSTSEWTADLCREFEWDTAQGKLVQVVFPGMYPDLTRYQAEADQAHVNQGIDTWKKDAVQTIQHAMVFQGLKIELVKGGGPNDLTAIVNVWIPSTEQTNIGSRVTQITLSRLEGNPRNIWVVTAIGSDWLLVNTPKSRATISSPLTVTGFGPQYDGKIGYLFIQDHLLQSIQDQQDGYEVMAPDSSSPPSKFSINVKYTSSFKGGAQEGIVVLVHTGIPASDYGWVSVKVLLNP